MMESVYLVIKEESRNIYPENENIERVKLGRSGTNSVEMKRMKSYGMQTEFLSCNAVKDSKYVEKRLKETFKRKFKSTKGGDEHYEGDKYVMQIEFNNVVNSYLEDQSKDNLVDSEEDQSKDNLAVEKYEYIKNQEDIVNKENELKEINNENKIKKQEKKLKKLDKRLEDAKRKSDNINYNISENDQSIINDNIIFYPEHRTSKNEFIVFLQSKNITISHKDLKNFLESKYGIKYDSNNAKKGKDNIKHRGVYHGVQLKSLNIP